MLSPNIPRIAPPRLHARTQSRSPTRNRLGDDLLSDLSPATTLEAFTSPSGKLKASIEAATPSERAFGIRATVASKKIQEWVTELSDWPWPAEGGSLGFEMPAAKRRKLSDPFTEPRTVQNGFEGANDNNGDDLQYVGSLLAAEVERYEDRIDEITEEMDELNVEDIKRQVLDTHFSPKSRPSSSASNAPPMPSLFASYTKMDDFTAVVTATVLQSLPNLSRLMRLMDVWTIRLIVLRKVPPLLRALDDAEIALRSGWGAIRNPGQDHPSGKRPVEEQIVSRQTFLTIMEVLQVKVTNLGKELDFMLDTLEGREDTLPDNWLDRMDLIERDYGEWVVAGDRKVREGEWALSEKKRREEEEARKLKEADLARLKAEWDALEAARLQALREAEAAETARLEAEAQEAARIKAEKEALEAARMKALREAEIAEAGRIEAQRQAQEASRKKAEEEALEAARLKALKQAEIAESARIEAEREALEIARRKAEEEAIETARLQAIQDAKEAESVRLKAQYEAEVVAAKNASEQVLEAARLKALRDSEEAEAARLKLKHEADEIAQLKVFAEAAEAENLRLENEAQELARLKGFIEAENAESARLKAEEEARNLARQRAEFEAAEANRMRIEQDLKEVERLRIEREFLKTETLRIAREFKESEQLRIAQELQDAETERLRIEQEFKEAERLRIQQELAEAERLRVEKEARESARLQAQKELEEAQALEAARLQAQRDAEQAKLKAEHEAELRRIQDEKEALEFACLQAQKEADASTRLRAADEEAREAARKKAEQDDVNAARLKAEQNAQIERLNAAREAKALELVRLQAEKDAKNVKLQAKREAQEAIRLKAEENAGLARIEAERSAQAARIQAAKELEDTTRFQAEQDAEIAKIKAEREATKIAQRKAKQESQEAERVWQAEISKQEVDDDARIVGVGRQESGTHLESEFPQARKDLEASNVAKSLNYQSGGADASKQTSMQATNTPCSPVKDTTTSSLNSAAQPTSIGAAESTVAVGLGIATTVAFIGASRSEPELSSRSVQLENDLELVECGCSVFDGSNGELSNSATTPSKVGGLETLSEPAIVNAKDFSVESPIKPDAVVSQGPTLGSPIHFDDQFDSQINTISNGPHIIDPLFAETPKTHAYEAYAPLPDSPSQLEADELAGTLSPTSVTSTNIGPMYDGATDVAEHNARRSSVGTGWIVIGAPDSDDDQDVMSQVSVQRGGGFNLDSKAESFRAKDNVKHVEHDESILASIESPTLDIEHEETQGDVAIPRKAGSFETPTKVAQSVDPEEYEDTSSILSPVLEEDLVPSIEVDSLDGSCAACDDYIQRVGEESSTLARKNSIAHIDTGLRRVSIPHRGSVSSNTSTVVTDRVREAPSSPIAYPGLDSSMLDNFQEDVEQSPSAGRVGQRGRKTYELSPPPSPLAIPRLSKQRSLQVLKTPRFGSEDPTAPSTPLDAPVFDNIDVTTAPILASPRKANNDEQLQQQISSLLESIPARIRLTSDQESTPFASQSLRPKKPRRSVTPSFRPSSSMSNYSSYSRAPTPSFTLAPAFSKTTQRSRGAVGNPEIKLYHLSRSTGEAPIKLFVRLVGENGERVMVRVGGGWADLGEYLKEYASHHGRRSMVEGAEKIEIQDLPSRVVSGSSISSKTTVRDNGRSTPMTISRPGSAIGNRPGSSLNVRKTRKSMGASDLAKPSRVSDIRNEDRGPSTPKPPANRRSYETPPSAASIGSSGGTAVSGRSSRLSWTEEDSSLGLAGPKAKKVVVSERDQEWIDSMKEKVKLASAEKEKRNRERERLELEKERKTSLGEMDRVGATKRLFRRGLADKTVDKTVGAGPKGP